MIKLINKFCPVRNVLFVAGEGSLIFLATVTSAFVISRTHNLTVDPYLAQKALLVALICQLCLYLFDLYDMRNSNTFSSMEPRLLLALGCGSLMLSILFKAVQPLSLHHQICISAIMLSAILIAVWRSGYSFILRRNYCDQKVLVLGESKVIGKIIREITFRQDCGFSLTRGKDIQDYSLLKNAALLDMKFIVLPSGVKLTSASRQILLLCRQNGVTIIDDLSFYESLTGKLLVRQIDEYRQPLLTGSPLSKIAQAAKQVLDQILALTLLLILSPVMLITAILIRLDSKGPVLFSQERLGMDKVSYKMYKFRSMVVDAEKKRGPTWATTDDERITWIGFYIRKWRIDELPQLWNVVKGEMSFIGPRPERDHFADKLSARIPYYNKRFMVKPGISGWAQVNYGYGATVEESEEKLNYDLYYIKNYSLLLDFIIIFQTVKTVVQGVKQGADEETFKNNTVQAVTR